MGAFYKGCCTTGSSVLDHCVCDPFRIDTSLLVLVLLGIADAPSDR